MKNKKEIRRYYQEYMKKYRQINKNKEKIKRYCRKWNKKNKEKIKKCQIKYQQTPKGKYIQYKNNAKQKKRIFKLTFDEFIEFWDKPCFYCKKDKKGIGLDRKNNLKGYEIDNVVSCCIICNRKKGSQDFNKFIKKFNLFNLYNMGLKQNFAVYSEPNSESATLFQVLATALTGSYVKIGAEMPVEGATTVFLHLYWTKGNETSIQIKAEYALLSGSTTSQPTTITTAAAESTVGVESYTFSTATDNIVIPFGVQGRFINLYIKATGGTPTGTYGAGIFFVRE